MGQCYNYHSESGDGIQTFPTHLSASLSHHLHVKYRQVKLYNRNTYVTVFANSGVSKNDTFKHNSLAHFGSPAALALSALSVAPVPFQSCHTLPGSWTKSLHTYSVLLHAQH